MEIEAAVFRKVREPLTIEAVDIDKPWGREVLVRTVATGVCHSVFSESVSTTTRRPSVSAYASTSSGTGLHAGSTGATLGASSLSPVLLPTTTWRARSTY